MLNEYFHSQHNLCFKTEHEKIKRPECLKRKFPSTSTATTSRHDYGTPSAKKPRINWYVKLAQESPEKSHVPTDDEDKYSAIHEAETGEFWFRFLSVIVGQYF